MFRESATAIILSEYISKYTTLPSFALTRTFSSTLAEKLRNMLGNATEKIAKALEESLFSEIAQAFKTKDIEEDFPRLAEKFWLRISLPLLELNQKITPLPSDKLKELIELEKRRHEKLQSSSETQAIGMPKTLSTASQQWSTTTHGS